MARQEIVATDQLDEGRVKINEMTLELYAAIAAAAAVSITGAISLDSTALGKIHFCTGTSANYTVDLPTAVGNTGNSIIFKGSSALTKDVTIAGISGQLIDGEANRKFSADGSITIMSDGANWFVINEVGSWVQYTPVWTGFSADPTLTFAEYFRVGKLCTVRVNCGSSGTSNATTTTVTLPFNSANVSHGPLMTIVNNGNPLTTPGLFATRVGSNVMDMYTNAALAAWTASSTKRGNFCATYRIQ